MRTPLELIVRPFVVTDITNPTQPALSSHTATSQNTDVTYGSDQVTSWSGSFNETVTFYYIKKPKEKQKASSDPLNPFAPPP